MAPRHSAENRSPRENEQITQQSPPHTNAHSKAIWEIIGGEAFAV